jgi:hypothetical protein
MDRLEHLLHAALLFGTRPDTGVEALLIRHIKCTQNPSFADALTAPRRALCGTYLGSPAVQIRSVSRRT